MPIGKIVDLQTILDGHPSGRDIGAIANDLALLANRRLIEPVHADHRPGDAERASCRSLNTALAELAAAGEDIGTFASPVLAGGFAVAQKDRQFLAGCLAGLRTPQELAEAADAWLASRAGQFAGERPQQHRKHTLLSEAEAFLSETMPVLQTLDMV
jgi:hypothetical protein